MKACGTNSFGLLRIWLHSDKVLALHPMYAESAMSTALGNCNPPFERGSESSVL